MRMVVRIFMFLFPQTNPWAKDLDATTTAETFSARLRLPCPRRGMTFVRALIQSLATPGHRLALTSEVDREHSWSFHRDRARTGRKRCPQVPLHE